MTDSEAYYHGTKADLKVDDLIGPGYTSNYGKRKQANFVYLAATLDAAIWGAELAIGEERGRIYVVEPTGSIAGEVTDWEGHSAERLKEMRDHLENLKQRGVEAIEE